MHILLTDITTCPVCGPTHGLILRSDSMVARRVLAGALGCPNCRRQFPITGGVAFLVADATAPGPAAAQAGSGTVAASNGDAAVRIAALLGLGEGTGFALLVGPVARHAADVAVLAPGFEIIADAAHAPDSSGISRVRIGNSIPFYAGKLRGVWLSGSSTALLAEGARVLHPLGRLVLEPAPQDAGIQLADAGLEVIAEEKETVLASRR